MLRSSSYSSFRNKCGKANVIGETWKVAIAGGRAFVYTEDIETGGRQISLTRESIICAIRQSSVDSTMDNYRSIGSDAASTQHRERQIECGRSGRRHPYPTNLFQGRLPHEERELKRGRKGGQPFSARHIRAIPWKSIWPPTSGAQPWRHRFPSYYYWSLKRGRRRRGRLEICRSMCASAYIPGDSRL
jgi:hypothetical protein